VNTEHGWGPWFFIAVVIAGAWPWFFFAPLGAIDLSRRDAGSPGYRSNLRFLILWFVVIFAFFSIPRAKLGSYILPALPALSIVAANGMYKLWKLESQRTRRIMIAFAAINLMIAIAATIAILATRQRLPPALRVDASIIVGLVAAMAIAAFIVNREGTRPGAMVLTLALTMILVMGTASRARNDGGPEVSYRELARELATQLHSGCVVGSYRHDVHSIPFYTGYREALVSYRGELAPFGDSPDAAASFINSDDAMRGLWSSGQCFALIVNRKDLGVLKTLVPAPVAVACEGKKVALINRSDARADATCEANAH